MSREHSAGKHVIAAAGVMLLSTAFLAPALTASPGPSNGSATPTPMATA